ncbi:hypothetical protein BDW68DRAFT_182686 [Aspergillus falconensis]
MVTAEFDYIILGADLTGCVVASHLKQSSPSLDIILLEAGFDPSDNPDVKTYPPIFSTLGPYIDLKYPTTPQPNTGNRVHTVHTGEALGGGTTINFAAWSRDSTHYDLWAETFGDQH